MSFSYVEKTRYFFDSDSDRKKVSGIRSLLVLCSWDWGFGKKKKKNHSYDVSLSGNLRCRNIFKFYFNPPPYLLYIVH